MQILLLGNDFPHPHPPIHETSSCKPLEALASEHEIRVIPPRSRAAVWQLATAWVPDIVLGSCEYLEAYLAVEIAQALGVPAVLLVGQRGPLSTLRQAQRRGVLKAFAAADALVAPSHEIARELEQSGIERGNLHVIPCGPDTIHPAPNDGPVRELSALLRSLAADAQQPDRPRWATWGPTPAGGMNIRPSFPRQVIRRGMELLPRDLFFTHGPRNQNGVYLTFDDGPHPEHTPRLLDELGRLGIKATFFVVGRQVLQYPELVRRMVAEGHAVANHTALHSDLRLLSASEAVFAAESLRGSLHTLLGKDVRAYRPPRGKIRPSQALALWRAGYTIILWSADARDWACESAEQVRTWARHHPLRGGDIILMHDRLPYAASAMQDLLDAAQTRGLQFQSLERADAGLR